MSVAVRATLQGMPESSDLRRSVHDGRTITYTPDTITVRLDRPTTPKITRALTLLTDQLNTNPPHIPGDPRPITYTITTP